MAQCLDTITLFYINALLRSLLSFVQWFAGLMIRSEKNYFKLYFEQFFHRSSKADHNTRTTCSFVIAVFSVAPGHIAYFVPQGEQTLKYMCLSPSNNLLPFCETNQEGFVFLK